ncbi:MAG: hypothetical protein AAF800_06375 [Planctomycetota bacterium]
MSAVIAGSAPAAATDAELFIDLAGPATGFAATFNFKNSTSQNNIQGLDGSGNPTPFHNGLPQYPNFRIPTGSTNAGVYSAIIASPQSTASDYAAALAPFYGGTSLTISNQTVTQPDFDTLSSGRIDFDHGLIAPVGSSVIGVDDLSFNFNTFTWDGVIAPGQTGDSRSNLTTPGAPLDISPLSPAYTPYNDGSGGGNAQIFYRISIDNVTGNGLTFLDSALLDMDFRGEILVEIFVAAAPTAGSLEYRGTLSTDTTPDPLGYAFAVAGIDSEAFFADTGFVMNRSGTASLVPEPAAGVSVLGVGLVAARRRPRGA